jgi:hypothetical protein
MFWLSFFVLDRATFVGYNRAMKKMPISYMTSNGNGYYLQKRIPKDLLQHYPDNRSGIIKRYLDTDLEEAKRKLAIGLAQLEEEWRR